MNDESNHDAALEGFKSVRTREPVTDGIDIWPEVFEVEHKLHGKVAVLVMDTQGIFSMNADFSESVAVFAISLMLSSVQVKLHYFYYNTSMYFGRWTLRISESETESSLRKH